MGISPFDSIFFSEEEPTKVLELCAIRNDLSDTFSFGMPEGSYEKVLVAFLKVENFFNLLKITFERSFIHRHRRGRKRGGGVGRRSNVSTLWDDPLRAFL